GDTQTPLIRADAAAQVQASLVSDADGYTVTVSVPRKLVKSDQALPAPVASTQPVRPVYGMAVINIAVHDNDEGLRTWTRSWANEEVGVGAWAWVSFVGPLPPPAVVPQNPLIPFLPKFP